MELFDELCDDAGDNVKFGFPQAFTVTMISWSVIDFGSRPSAKKELDNALAAIKWGTDYSIKAHPQANVLYGQVGNGDADHACRERPEDMTTPRTSYKIDEQHPGSDLAGGTAVAFAAASIAFSKSDPDYSSQLLDHAKQLFDFANSHQGMYQRTPTLAADFRMNCCGQLHGCTAPQMIKPTQIILVVPKTQVVPEPCFLGMTSTLEPKSPSPSLF